MKDRKPLLIIVICIILLESAFLARCPCVWTEHHEKHHKSGQYEPDEAISTSTQDIDAAYSSWMDQNEDTLAVSFLNRNKMNNAEYVVFENWCLKKWLEREALNLED